MRLPCPLPSSPCPRDAVPGLPFPFALQLLPLFATPGSICAKASICAVPRHRPAWAAAHTLRGGWHCPQRGRRPGGPCPWRGLCAGTPATDAAPSAPLLSLAQGTSRGDRSHRGQTTQAGGGCPPGGAGGSGVGAGVRTCERGWLLAHARVGWCSVPGAAHGLAARSPGGGAVRAAVGFLGVGSAGWDPHRVPCAHLHSPGRQESRAAPSCCRCRWGRWDRSPTVPHTEPGSMRTPGASPGRASTATCRVSRWGGGSLPFPVGGVSSFSGGVPFRSWGACGGPLPSGDACGQAVAVCAP